MSSSRGSRSPRPSSSSKQIAKKKSLFCVGWGEEPRHPAALSQSRKTHEINVMSMVFGGETPRRSVKVTLPSPLVPRRYGGSEMRWRMTVWQCCLCRHRLFHLCVYHLHVADPDIRRCPPRNIGTAAVPSLCFDRRGRGSSLGGPPQFPPPTPPSPSL